MPEFKPREKAFSKKVQDDGDWLAWGDSDDDVHSYCHNETF